MPIRYMGHIYVLALQEQKLEDAPERSSTRWEYAVIEREINELTKRAHKEFMRLLSPTGEAALIAAKAKQEHGKDDRKVRAQWREEATNNEAIKAFIALCNVDNNEKTAKALFARLTEVALRIQTKKDTWPKIVNMIRNEIITSRQEEARQQMYGVGLPREIIQEVFPESFAVRIGPNGEILEELSVFGNRYRTEQEKAKEMAILLDNWNKLVDALDRDMKSNDEVTRLCAIVTSIIAHTGIRPGSEGESRDKDEEGAPIKDENGNYVKVKTVGATGLTKEHIEFVRDDFVRLEFKGKAATKNISDIEDASLAAALRQHIEAARKDKDGPIFVTNDGKKISPEMVNDYMRNIIGEYIQANSFRKLRATRVIYDELRKNKIELAAALRQIEAKTEEDFRVKAIYTVRDHILKAAERARLAINHKDVDTTLKSYIAPNVILEYLITAGFERSLEVAMRDSRKLVMRFDIMDFFEKMTGVKPELRGKESAAGGTTFYEDQKFAPFNIGALLAELEAVPPPTESA